MVGWKYLLSSNDVSVSATRCRNGHVEQLKLAMCSVTITPDNWSTPQSISIRATKDFKYDGTRARLIEFNMTEGLGRSVWDGYVPHSIQVRVVISCPQIFWMYVAIYADCILPQIIIALVVFLY